MQNLDLRIKNYNLQSKIKACKSYDNSEIWILDSGLTKRLQGVSI